MKTVTPMKPSPDYAEAASRYLVAEAATRYCAGDMTATDEAGHEAIAAEASKVAAERCEEKLLRRLTQ